MPARQMDLRLRRGVWLAWVLAAAACTRAPAVETGREGVSADTQPPNIVIIVSDDQGWNDVGYHGSRIRTPHLDRLALGGVRLKQHYVFPTCSPSRVALLTGRNPARFNVLGPLGAAHQVRARDVRMTSALQSLGFTTHLSGKWHIGESEAHRPRQFGFTTSYGYLRGQVDPYTHRYKTGDHRTWHRNDRFVEEEGHVTRLVTDEAVRVVQEAATKARPFFLYVAHHAPHYPLNEPPAWIEPYRSVFDDVWRQHFAASVTHMDHEIGRLVEALERARLRRRTLIVFFSDNGAQDRWASPPSEYNGRYAPHTTLGDNRPLRGWKTQLYEGGIRVPAFANWPGVLPAGREVGEAVHVVDWAPTIIRLAGGELSSDWRLEGRDLWPLLTGRSTAWPERRFYWNADGRQWAVRDGPWKLIMDADGSTQLFNIESDPAERRDLARAQPHRVRLLSERLRAERARDGEAVGSGAARD